MSAEKTEGGIIVPNEIYRAEHKRDRAVSEPLSPPDLVSMAVRNGASIEYVQQLIDMRRELDRDEARKAYNRAFAAFKAEAIRIIKSATVTDGPLKGKTYAKLHDVVNYVTPHLSANGLSAAWKITKDDRDWIEVTCTISHESGHSECVSMGGPPDTGGAKNSIHARASTVTYLQRYTLKAITGLSEQDDDNDGNGSVGALISDDQYATIQAMMDETGTKSESFLRVLKLPRLDDIPAASYPMVIGLLEAKRASSNKE